MADTYQTKLTVNGRNPGDNTLEVYRTAGTDCTELAATYRNQHFWLPTGNNWMTRKWISGENQDDGFKQCVCVNATNPTITSACLVNNCNGEQFSVPSRVGVVLDGFSGCTWTDTTTEVILSRYTVNDEIDITGTVVAPYVESTAGFSSILLAVKNGQYSGCADLDDEYDGICVRWIDSFFYPLQVVGNTPRDIFKGRVTVELYESSEGCGYLLVCLVHAAESTNFSKLTTPVALYYSEITNLPSVAELEAWLMAPIELSKCWVLPNGGAGLFGYCVDGLTAPSTIRIVPA